MVLEIGNDGKPSAFVVIKVQVKKGGKVGEMITNQDATDDDDRAMIQASSWWITSEQRRKVRCMPASGLSS